MTFVKKFGLTEANFQVIASSAARNKRLISKSGFLSRAAYFWDLKKSLCIYTFQNCEFLICITKILSNLILFLKNRFAITLGSIGDYESTQEKIKNGYVFKVNLKLYIVEKFNYVRSNAK